MQTLTLALQNSKFVKPAFGCLDGDWGCFHFSRAISQNTPNARTVPKMHGGCGFYELGAFWIVTAAYSVAAYSAAASALCLVRDG